MSGLEGCTLLEQGHHGEGFKFGVTQSRIQTDDHGEGLKQIISKGVKNEKSRHGYSLCKNK